MELCLIVSIGRSSFSPFKLPDFPSTESPWSIRTESLRTLVVLDLSYGKHTSPHSSLWVLKSRYPICALCCAELYPDCRADLSSQHTCSLSVGDTGTVPTSSEWWHQPSMSKSLGNEKKKKRLMCGVSWPSEDYWIFPETLKTLERDGKSARDVCTGKSMNSTWKMFLL